MDTFSGCQQVDDDALSDAAGPPPAEPGSGPGPASVPLKCILLIFSKRVIVKQILFVFAPLRIENNFNIVAIEPGEKVKRK